MNSKKLPISSTPIIGYVVHAFPLSIIFNYDKCMPWFSCNYIQLICRTTLKNNFFDFFTLCTATEIPWIGSIYPGIPWLNTHSIDNYTLIDCNININRSIINSLMRDNYIVCHLDEYYVPNRPTYQKEHFFHENMIYGFDNDKKEYNILGFDSKGIFNSTKISYDEFEQASSDLASHNHDIKLLHIKDDFTYDLDLNCIRNSLLDYLNGENSSSKYTILRNPTTDFAYGIDIYEQLIKYLKLLHNNVGVNDIRPFHLLWEHKKCMVIRIEYLMNKYTSTVCDLEAIKDEYITIQQICFSIRNLFLKYNMTKRVEIIEKIIPLLEDVCDREQSIIPRFITEIERLEKA
ncbi:hypothetical protein [Vallitalea maricola]|uniref:Uncharacterized protein n=1 Tax=Vallitalea maricola TaxID=3074433 RepID=A0ACB5UGB7_9FIRM|nr:hypothetical protein AN2V17_08690 [Vallitalea sp. AN17-2]